MTGADPVTMWISFALIAAGLILSHSPLIRVLSDRNRRRP